jgi:hypothetical protein
MHITCLLLFLLPGTRILALYYIVPTPKKLLLRYFNAYRAVV